MAENKQVFKFERGQANIPRPIEKINYSTKWVNFGENNLYPEFLIELYKISPLHSAIMNKKFDMAIGKDIKFLIILFISS